jgi:hypothetical protein
MPTINAEGPLSRDELLKAVRQLSQADFQQFVAGVLDLRAERQTSRLTAPEADLLLRINAGLPAGLRERFRELVEKRDADSLTTDEHAELLRLTEEVERREAERLTALSELAHLRHTSLAVVMEQLGIRAPANG